MKPKKNKRDPRETPFSTIGGDTKKSILAVLLVGSAIVLILAGISKAGPAGDLIYKFLTYLLGIGYFAVPVIFILMAVIFLVSDRQRFILVTFFGGCVLVLSILGLIDLVSLNEGGLLGKIFGALRYPFGGIASIIIDIVFIIASFLLMMNIPIKIDFRRKEKLAIDEPEENYNEGYEETKKEPEKENKKIEEFEKEIYEEPEEFYTKKHPSKRQEKVVLHQDFAFPPLSLLKSATEKPTTGDLRANANIIKRTLENFGIGVEMSEINVGPKVTRYTLKPAEGIKLSRITALSQDLALALAAHPIRIEAPIPGKSLVGIEVPNKAAALVRLGSLLSYDEFKKSGLLAFPLGRDVSGESIFVNIEKMPHLLIAGATGSGKSVTIHSLIVALLYKNSPETLKLILIDPKRVELSAYDGIPHLISPVITDNKKSLAVFRWAIAEMDKRYDTLQQAGRRDIQSYNSNLTAGEERLPYILIVIDELADLMTSYGREVEGCIVRLAQMARATGIHLILSTQRPSVEIITGLIKANITARVALQVASQVDSRTILDTSGAEKLLGSGDMLFISSDISKPKRIQSAYVTEEEIQKVANFIRNQNSEWVTEEIDAPVNPGMSDTEESGDIFENYLEGEKDEMYEEAVKVVMEAKKASASLLQRRLQVGYARAARLLDLMETDGFIGPGEGAKPRDIFEEHIEEYLSSKVD
ncbi:MAG: DNA translocase FtsK [Patescibacteria group bacterium]|nr:DNA translocase FtsK [Patescibacteria group bacterium]